MSKAKKILLTVLLTVLTLLVLANSLFLYILYASIPRGVEINPLEDYFYDIDDIAYIRADVGRLDAQKVEDGQIKSYFDHEIAQAINEAIDRRDAKNKANVPTE